ncbi:MAG: T9SS type A sorting domain-containing protein [Chitinophagales bacterium]
MKELFAALIIALPNFILAQITVTENDIPSAGSIYFLDNAPLTYLIDLSQTGANESWDFSDLTFNSANADSFLSTNDLPFIYQIAFLSSNLAEKNGINLSYGQFVLSDVYTVYKKSSSQYEIDGYAGTLDGLPLPMPYSSKDIVYRFPLNYSNQDSADASIILAIPGLGYLSQQRHRVNEVDGWGIITTPVGTFNALRVKSTITDVDSIYADTLGFGTMLTLKSYEYKWLAQGKGIPVMQVNAQDVAGIPVVSQILYQDTALQSGVPEISAQNEMKVYPNPAVNFLNITSSNPLPVQFFIWNSEGKLIEKEYSSGQISTDVSQWQNGIYFICYPQGNSVFTFAFLVEH